jgi:hypothetical protein
MHEPPPAPEPSVQVGREEETARELCIASKYVSADAHACFGIGGAGNCPNCHRIVAALRAARADAAKKERERCAKFVDDYGGIGDDEEAWASGVAKSLRALPDSDEPRGEKK